MFHYTAGARWMKIEKLLEESWAAEAEKGETRDHSKFHNKHKKIKKDEDKARRDDVISRSTADHSALTLLYDENGR